MKISHLCLLTIFFCGAFVFGKTISHEIAINKLQVEISKCEILKEECRLFKKHSLLFAWCSASCIFLAALTRDPVIFTVVSSLACYIHWPTFMLPYYERRADMLRGHIKRLSLEES